MQSCYKCKNIDAPKRFSLLSHLAFTLAEVLIVLGIIGTVAEMTIPTLYKDVKDIQYKTTFMRAYSELQGVINNIVHENGGSMVGVAGDYTALRQAFSAYFRKIKECNYGEAAGICWHQEGVVKNYSGYNDNWATDIQGYVIMNGVFVQTYFYDEDAYQCSIDIGNINACGWMRIDVNGFVGPNRIGRDIFMLHILKDRIIPQGLESTGDTSLASSTCRKGGNGYGCAAYVVTGTDY